MTPIPPDAKRVVLAAVVPCRWTNDPCKSPDDWPRLCRGCNSDGTRTVVTDIEVRRYQGVIDDAAGPTAWREAK